MNLYEDHAREKTGMGPEWRLYSWDSIDALKLGHSHPDGRMKIKGAVAPNLEDGRPAWAYMDKATKRTVIFTHAEHDAFVLAWEMRTGKCSGCAKDHPGQEYLGWSKDKGTLMGTCPRCHGTNVAPHLAQATA